VKRYAAKGELCETRITLTTLTEPVAKDLAEPLPSLLDDLDAA
jgi:5-bromo-4-chloroindolyl phosphate hydrolysis protein